MEVTRRRSHKREAILDCIRGTKTHPSAEWIYEQLKPNHPDLSLGTVYRNLALFRESGEIVSVATVNGTERLDANTAPHAHFVCESCNAVLDVEVVQESLSAKLEREYNLEIWRSELLFRGLCPTCKAKRIRTPDAS